MHLGTSVNTADYILSNFVQNSMPCTVVDFGAGKGKNGKIVKSINKSATITGVDGYEPAIEVLKECEAYDHCFCGLIQEYKPQKKCDMAIFGDVLEHLDKKDIYKVIDQSLSTFKYVFIVVPLFDIFQDEIDENDLEIHRTYITEKFFDRYNPIEKHIIKKYGRKTMCIVISSEEQKDPVYKIISQGIFHYFILSVQLFGSARPVVDFLKRYFLKYKWLLR